MTTFKLDNLYIMKKTLLLLAIFLFGGFNLKAVTEETDSTGLPGDNLDLYGVLDLFKQSSSLEDFEKKLNDPTNEINNLDLNDDQNVDYIRVVDQMQGDAHAIVLQVPISETESQDVAAIELEKNGTESADLQVVGDEELYGEDYIIEATDETKTSTTDGKWQGFRPVVVVNVWMWPCVRFIYAPAYVVWISPYRWAHYPAYWKPWHPVRWHVHHARVVRYHHPHYVCVHTRRMVRAHAHYHNHRVHSAAVHHRYEGHHQRHAANQAQRNGKGGNSGQKQNVSSRPHEQSSGHSTGKKGGPKGGAKPGPKGGKKAPAPKKGGGGRR